jgi:nitrogen fixation protein NifU and related proteins
MSLADAYREIVLAHARAPHHLGRLSEASLRAEGVNALCGDRLAIDLLIDEGRIVRFGFEAEASALTLAATSVMGDLILGRTLEEVRRLGERALEQMTAAEPEPDPALGEFRHFESVRGYPNRIKTVTLPWATLLGALAGRERTSTDIDPRGASPPERSRKP